MTLQEIVEKIWAKASQQPNVNTIVKTNDIYDLNVPDVKYAAFCLTQQPHTQAEDWLYFNFYLYYADRLRSDKSNILQVQSNALSVLKNIITGLSEDGLTISNITYYPFQQKFEAETAGMYASINIAIPIEDLCSEQYT